MTRPWTSNDPGCCGFGFVVHVAGRNEVNKFLYPLLPYGCYEDAFLQVSLCKTSNVETALAGMRSPSGRNALFATTFEGRKAALKNSQAANYSMVFTFRVPREAAELHPEWHNEIKSKHRDFLTRLGAQYSEFAIGYSIENTELEQSEIGELFRKLSIGPSSSFAILPKSRVVNPLDALDIISSISGAAVITQTFYLGNQAKCRRGYLNTIASILGITKQRLDPGVSKLNSDEGIIRSIVVTTLEAHQRFELGDKTEYSTKKSEGVHDFSFSVPRKGFEKILKYGVTIQDRFADQFIHFRMPYKGNTESGAIVSSEGGQIALFDVFESHADYNLAITGGPGSGTTHTSNEILFHHLSTNGYAICLDACHGTREFSEIVNGVHIDSSEKGGINPFSLLPDPDTFEYLEVLACITEIVFRLIGAEEGDDRAIVQGQIADVFIRGGKTATLSDLFQRLNHQGLSHLSQPLAAFSTQGDYAKFFSIQAQDIPNEGLVVFDVPIVGSLPDRLRTAIHCSLLALFQQKIQQLPTRTKKMLVHKECTLFFKDPAIVHELEKTMRQARRSGASVITINQSLLDYLDDAGARVLFDCCSTKIIHSQKAEVFSGARISQVLDISDSELELLKRLRGYPGSYVEAGLFLQGQTTRIRFSADPVLNSLYKYR
jgi:hypothetical protein